MNEMDGAERRSERSLEELRTSRGLVSFGYKTGSQPHEPLTGPGAAFPAGGIGEQDTKKEGNQNSMDPPRG